MATFGRPLHRYTYALYVALENDRSTKHEFFDGEIYAMPSGSEDHSALAVNVLVALLAAGEDRPLPCAYLRSPHVRRSRRAGDVPDGSVICGPMQQHAPSPNATALNPMILLEVTSNASEEYDTGIKLACYQTIPSLREVILVSHRERRITVHRRSLLGRELLANGDDGNGVATCEDFRDPCQEMKHRLRKSNLFSRRTDKTWLR